MSYDDYKLSLEISAQGYPFCALIMAAFRDADTDNLMALQEAFPYIYDEFKRRYNAPGGYLNSQNDLETNNESNL